MKSRKFVTIYSALCFWGCFSTGFDQWGLQDDPLICFCCVQRNMREKKRDKLPVSGEQNIRTAPLLQCSSHQEQRQTVEGAQVQSKQTAASIISKATEIVSGNRAGLRPLCGTDKASYDTSHGLRGPWRGGGLSDLCSAIARAEPRYWLTISTKRRLNSRKHASIQMIEKHCPVYCSTSFLWTLHIIWRDLWAFTGSRQDVLLGYRQLLVIIHISSAKHELFNPHSRT